MFSSGIFLLKGKGMKVFLDEIKQGVHHSFVLGCSDVVLELEVIWKIKREMEWNSAELSPATTHSAVVHTLLMLEPCCCPANIIRAES